MDALTQIIPADELRLYCDPFSSPVWIGMEEPVTRDEIAECIEQGKTSGPGEDGEFSHDIFDPVDREMHIQRIAWFVGREIEDPIVVDVGMEEFGPPPHWMIRDGNHRFAALLFDDADEVKVAFGGHIDRMDDLFESFDPEPVRKELE